uniref:Pco130633 n=1 Tax=Arundo donax TaxID=35708 RepID=A0A0A9TBW8_ARUDO
MEQRILRRAKTRACCHLVHSTLQKLINVQKVLRQESIHGIVGGKIKVSNGLANGH